MRTITLEEHFVTQSFLRAAGAYGPSSLPRLAELQPRLLDIGAGRIAAMNEASIDFQILSLAAIGFESLDAATACPLARDINDVIVAFEVLSPSTEERDLRWKRTAYTSLPSLTHYVVIAQDAVDVVVFARDAEFAQRHFRSLNETIELPALGVSLPLAEIYRDTGLR